MSRILRAVETVLSGSAITLEVLDDVIFDTVEVPPHGGFARLFGNVVDDQESLIRTNQVLPNRLPNPQQFEVTRLYCAFFNHDGVLPASHPLYWHSCVTFQYGDNNRPYWHSPCWAIAHPMAILANLTGFSPDHLQAVIEACSIGKLTNPVVLRHDLYINGSLIVDGQFADMEFVCLMAGERVRSMAL